MLPVLPTEIVWRWTAVEAPAVKLRFEGVTLSSGCVLITRRTGTIIGTAVCSGVWIATCAVYTPGGKLPGVAETVTLLGVA